MNPLKRKRSEAEDKKRPRLRRMVDVENERQKREHEKILLKTQSDDEAYSSDMDDFIVYSEDDDDGDSNDESDVDSLDAVSMKLGSAIGLLPAHARDIVTDVLNHTDDDDEMDEDINENLESRRLRECLGEVIVDNDDDEPKLLVSGRRSKIYLAWRKKMLGRDKLRGQSMAQLTPPGALVCGDLGLRTPLFFHQIVGVLWCMMREEMPYKGLRGGILADDMGAGKSLQMLSLIAMDKYNGYAASHSLDIPHEPPTLIVCPAVLTDSWMDETRRHFGYEYVRPILLKSSTAKNWANTITVNQIRDADLVIISYAGLRNVYESLRSELRSHMNANIAMFSHYFIDLDIQDVERVSERIKKITHVLDIGYKTIWSNPSKWTAKHFLFGYAWRRAVFDECTHFKNKSTKNFKAVRCLDAERRWSLSGTPMENRPDELYSQLVVLGVADTSPIIRTPDLWRKLVTHDAFGCEIRTHDGRPTDYAIDVLKREFLNVLVLRREIQTISFIDPLSAYVERATADTNLALCWDDFVEDVITLQQLRNDSEFDRNGAAIQKRRSFARHSEEEEEEEEEQQEEGGDDDNGIAMDHLNPPQHADLPGFYWEMSQEVFVSAFQRVERWFAIATGLSVRAMAVGLSEARIKMRAQNIRDMPDTEEGIRSLFDKVIFQWPSGLPVIVWPGFSIPKSILLMGRMHALEEAVYSHLTERSKKTINNADASSADIRNSAFSSIVSHRITVLDYRYAKSAARFLDNQRGKIWSMDEPYVDLDLETRNVYAKDEADAIRELAETMLEPAEPAEPAEDDEDDEDDEDADVGHSICRVPLRPPTKYLMLERYVRACPEDDKILVYSDIVRFFPLFKKYFEDKGIRCAVLCGSMSPKERDEALAHFRRPGKKGARIFFLSLMLAKQGLNLQEANHVVLDSQWWNPSVEAQAERRVARPGQKKQVFFVRLALLDTIDEIVLTRAGVKTEMITQMIGRDDGIISTGANFARPDENRGLFLDTTQPPPENETLADLAALPIVDFTPNAEVLLKMKGLHKSDGRLDKSKLASVLVDGVLRNKWRIVESTPPPPLPENIQ